MIKIENWEYPPDLEKEKREKWSVDEEAETLEVEVEVERGKWFGRLRLRVVLMEVGDTEIPNGMVRISWTVFFLSVYQESEILCFSYFGVCSESVIIGHTSTQLSLLCFDSKF